MSLPEISLPRFVLQYSFNPRKLRLLVSMASSSFVRITVLIWADILTAYALFVMMTYLTNVWKLNFTHAAAIVNVFSGVATIMPIGMAFLVDAFMGDYWMLLLSSLAYSFGLSFLEMSTPHVLPDAARNCDAHKPDCIGDAQKPLLPRRFVISHQMIFKSLTRRVSGALTRLPLKSKPKIKSRLNKVDGNFAPEKRWRILKWLYA
ncbi:hypothetical protein CMV_019426 [Castanea mollissima]|uniref:Uncharacterized protein n=1 Tax=Castanea mollissima TaxID=60419 RepID=A0A8J4R0D6_9ROSI|nr:hypothetical protein CMV_019426 [Castanea mollissima]